MNYKKSNTKIVFQFSKFCSETGSYRITYILVHVDEASGNIVVICGKDNGFILIEEVWVGQRY